MERNSRKLIKRLEKDGWILARSKGSHQSFKHPEKSFLITVPHPKELKTVLARALAKQAGWED